jgi:hypothetical protein
MLVGTDASSITSCVGSEEVEVVPLEDVVEELVVVEEDDRSTST